MNMSKKFLNSRANGFPRKMTTSDFAPMNLWTNICHFDLSFFRSNVTNNEGMVSAYFLFKYPFKFIHSTTREICKRGISIAYNS